MGPIPPGGAWSVHGGGQVSNKQSGWVGYEYLHVAIDDYSREAYVETQDDEQSATLIEFRDRARRWCHARGMTVGGVITDNGSKARSRLFARALVRRRIKHIQPRPYRPQTDGKFQRFNRTMTNEFLYARRFRSEPERRRRLDRWVHNYHHYRDHTAINPRTQRHWPLQLASGACEHSIEYSGILPRCSAASRLFGRVGVANLRAMNQKVFS